MEAKTLSATAVLQTLRKRYTPQRTFLAFRTPLDLLVATVLSAQCTDVRVNHVTKTILYPKYKKAQDYVRVPRVELEADIRTCGFYRTKAKHIQGLCHILLQKHGGKVPQKMEDLTELPGVGRKTAAIILWACFKKNEGVAVDTHVLRVAQRLGLTKHADPKRIELDLMAALPRKEWGHVTTLLISLGRDACTARNRQCGRCAFRRQCPSSTVLGRQDLASRRPQARRTRATGRPRRRANL